ncbi:MAG: hypothetical protein D6741_20135, partial [Planctomycetota bacterium]
AGRAEQVPSWFSLIESIPDDSMQYPLPEALCTAARLRWLWTQGEGDSAAELLLAEIEAGRPIAMEVLDVIARLPEDQAKRLSVLLGQRARENSGDRSTFFLRLEAALRSGDAATATRLLHDGWPSMTLGIDPATRRPAVWFRDAWKTILREQSDRTETDPAAALVWLLNGGGSDDRFDTALDCIQRECRDPAIFATVGQSLELQGRWADAATCYALAARLCDATLKTTRLSLELNAARSRIEAGEYAQAEAAIERLRRELPTLDERYRLAIDLSLMVIEARLAEDEGDAERALPLWRRAWEASTQAATNRDTRREIGLALAGVLLSAGKRHEAETVLVDLVGEFPACHRALNDLGYLWTETGRHSATAEILLRRAVLLAPEQAAYRDSLGCLLCRRGEADAAVAQLEQAVAIEEDPAILEHLGDAYAAAGRLDDAVRAWKRAVEAYKHEDDNSKRLSIQNKIDNCRDALPKGDGRR